MKAIPVSILSILDVSITRTGSKVRRGKWNFRPSPPPQTIKQIIMLKVSFSISESARERVLLSRWINNQVRADKTNPCRGLFDIKTHSYPFRGEGVIKRTPAVADHVDDDDEGHSRNHNHRPWLLSIIRACAGQAFIYFNASRPRECLPAVDEIIPHQMSIGEKEREPRSQRSPEDE